MKKQFIYVYKVNGQSSSIYYKPEYGCSHFFATEKKLKEHLQFWLVREIAQKDSTAIMPIFLDTETYQDIIGESTFCSKEKIIELLLANNEAAKAQNDDSSIEIYCQTLSIPLSLITSRQSFKTYSQ